MGNGVRFILIFLAAIVLSAGFSGAIDVSSCRIITQPGVYTLTSDISSSGACITINSSNVVLDCEGHTIRYVNYTGPSGYGVGLLCYSEGAAYRTNVTVENCALRQETGLPSGTGGTGISVCQGGNIVIRNNSIFAQGWGSSGMSINADNSLITGNTLNITASWGLSGSGTNSTYSNNYVSIPGSWNWNFAALGMNGFNNTFINNVAIGDNALGIVVGGSYYTSTSMGLVVKNNTAISNSRTALAFYGGINYSFIGNTVKSNTGYGMVVTQGYNDRNVLIGNNVTSGNSTALYIYYRYSVVHDLMLINNSFIGQPALHLEGAKGLRFIGNTFGNSSTNTAIYLLNYCENNTFIDSTLRARDRWIDSWTPTTNNFTNTRFEEQSYGSIRSFSSILTTTYYEGLNQSVVNISFNRAFIASSSRFNKSAIITLKGLSFPNAEPIVYSDSSRTFENCTAPRCNKISYSGGILVFNVSSAGTYSSQSTAGETTAPTTPTPEENETPVTPPEEENVTTPISCYEFLDQDSCENAGDLAAEDPGCIGDSCACVWNATQNKCTLEWDFTYNLGGTTNCQYKCVVEGEPETECSGGSKILGLVAHAVLLNPEVRDCPISPPALESRCMSSSATVPCGSLGENLPFFGSWQILAGIALTIAIYALLNRRRL